MRSRARSRTRPSSRTPSGSRAGLHRPTCTRRDRRQASPRPGSRLRAHCGAGRGRRRHRPAGPPVRPAVAPRGGRLGARDLGAPERPQAGTTALAMARGLRVPAVPESRLARRSVDRQLLAHGITKAVTAGGRRQSLAVLCLGNSDDMRYAVIEAASELRRGGVASRSSTSPCRAASAPQLAGWRGGMPRSGPRCSARASFRR